MPLTVTVLPLAAVLSLKVALASLSVSTSLATRLSPSTTVARLLPSYTLSLAVAVTVSARLLTLPIAPVAGPAI